LKPLLDTLARSTRALRDADDGRRASDVAESAAGTAGPAPHA
jgi:hypothetical protein